MKKAGYLIKIVPPFGYRVFRVEFTRAHLVFAAVLSLVTFGGVAGWYGFTMWHAEARVGELRNLTADQGQRLQQIDAQAAQLDGELRAIEQQNARIRKMIGDRGKAGSAAPAEPAASPDNRRSMTTAHGADFDAVAIRMARLREHSAEVRGEDDRLREVALRVLNMRRLEEISRAQLLAAIPSILPAGSGDIASGFGWRLIPWPEFHQGVDLTADYGDQVRAGAAGTIVAAGWDGGFGLKVDIDHGNGYHTWYAHLSRIDVHQGDYVRKAQPIALVGSTGESTGPHLHYQIMLDGKPVNPEPYLHGVPDKVLASLK